MVVMPAQRDSPDELITRQQALLSSLKHCHWSVFTAIYLFDILVCSVNSQCDCQVDFH